MLHSRTCALKFLFSFKISCNYNDGKAMLNGVIVLGVIAHIFPLHKKNEAAVEKKNENLSHFVGGNDEIFLYLSMCHLRIIHTGFNLLMLRIRLHSR